MKKNENIPMAALNKNFIPVVFDMSVRLFLTLQTIATSIRINLTQCYQTHIYNTQHLMVMMMKFSYFICTNETFIYVERNKKLVVRHKTFRVKFIAFSNI